MRIEKISIERETKLYKSRILPSLALKYKVVPRERIKPSFLQKTCLKPLSGFFASVFWYLIM